MATNFGGKCETERQADNDISNIFFGQLGKKVRVNTSFHLITSFKIHISNIIMERKIEIH